MEKTHRYRADVVWTGNLGAGTKSYGAYERRYEIRCTGKAPIMGSSDPAFRGDRRLHNPEELLAASVSACHMLWYLHLAASAGVVVIAYEDSVEGTMIEAADGSGRFTEMSLRPASASPQAPTPPWPSDCTKPRTPSASSPIP